MSVSYQETGQTNIFKKENQWKKGKENHDTVIFDETPMQHSKWFEVNGQFVDRNTKLGFLMVV